MNLFKKQASFKLYSQNKLPWIQSQAWYILALTNSELKEIVKILVKPQVAITNSEIKVDWLNPYVAVTNSDFRRA